jgi:23S rRNA (uracil1939-C5)-methyltransferase
VPKDADEIIRNVASIIHTDSDVVVLLDPPRKGVSEEVITAIKMLQEVYSNFRVVYISCNPATLARDLSKLTEFMSIDSIVPYDMFAQTKHVETVVLMSKVGVEYA